MSEVEFIFDGSPVNVQCNPDEKMNEILSRFSSKVGKKIEELYFIYGGGIVDEDLTFSNQINKSDKERNKMSILVNTKSDGDKEESLKKSEYIICPICNESARILIDNYKIGIYGCMNGHKTDNILINKFEQTQNVDEAKIKCQNCKKVDKSTSYNNIFFICFDCKQKLCQLCKSIHDKKHNVIDYDDKFFTCELHCEFYNSYCDDCKRDTCISCEMEHTGHKIITYGSILPNIKKIKEEKDEFYNKKEALKKDIKDIINKLNNLIYTMDDYFEIYEDIINSYGNKKRNYSILQNIHDMKKFNDNFIQDVNKILEEKNIFNKFQKIINMHDKSCILVDTNKISSTKIIENNPNLNNNNYQINKENIDIEKENDNNKNKEEKDIKKMDDDVVKIKNENNKKKKIIVDINEKLMIASEERQDNNYTDFDLRKMNKILTFRGFKLMKLQAFILKDGRIIIYNNNEFSYNTCYVLDLKNSNYFKLDLRIIYDIIQMDDGNVIAATDLGILLLDIKEQNIETIKTLKLYDYYRNNQFRFIKSTEHSILFLTYQYTRDFSFDIQTLVYEKDNIKSLDDWRMLKSTKNIMSNSNFCLIYIKNKNEIIFNSKESGILKDSYYINLIDLEKDKKIESFQVSSEDDPFALINDDIFVFAKNRKIFSVDLKKPKKPKDFKFDKGNDIHSIAPLNQKKFIVAQTDYLNQFELDKDNNLKMIYSIEINNFKLMKFPKDRILFYEGKYNDNVLLYG